MFFIIPTFFYSSILMVTHLEAIKIMAHAGNAGIRNKQPVDEG